MADYELITWSSNKRPKLLDSATAQVDFSSVRLGGDHLTISDNGGAVSFNNNPIQDITSISIGANNLKILETSGNFDFSGYKLTNLGTPTNAADATTKAYVDGVAQGLDVKGSVDALAASALAVTASGSGVGKTLTATGNGVLSVDGVNTWVDITNDGAVNNPFPSSGTPASRVLVIGNGANNGIYAVQNKGSGGSPYVLVRASDADTNPEVTSGLFTFVTEGTTYATTGWVLSTVDPIYLEGTPLTFTQFSFAGVMSAGNGITINGTVISVQLSGTPGLEFSGTALQVKDGDGIKVDANGVEADLAAAGSGTGGLQIVSHQIAVEAGDGIWLTPTGVAANLATSGLNTGGLEIVGGQIAVDAGLGIVLTANGVQADLAAAGSGTGGLQFVGNQVAVEAGDGIKLTSTGVNANLAAAGSGTGGLQIVGGQIAVEVGDGLKLDANGVEANLAAAGSGTGGLQIVGGQIAVETNVGIKLTSLGLEADLEAAGSGTGGLEFNGNSIQVKAGDGIKLDANGVEANLAAAGSGTGGLQIVGGQIAVEVGDGLKLDANGVEANLAAAGSGTGGLQIVSGQVAVKAGDGIELNANGVSVTVGDGLQIVSDTVTAKYTQSLTNDNAGSITVTQIVYVKANGHVDLAQANLTDFNTRALGVVADASIATGAPGNVYIRRGAVISGFSGMTPGAEEYVSVSTAGALTESLSAFAVGNFVYSVGRALSSTQLIFDPQFIVEY